MTGEPHFPARFDPEAFREDMARTTPAGCDAAEAARRRYEAGGVPRSELRPCDPEHREGTRLPQCLKVYLPAPAGRFGMVFRFAIADDSPRLDYLAFGIRHHPPDSYAPTVYEFAHRRLHGPDS
ncbi:MAG TPA: hypothetical protein VH299_08040 [Solirubrobacterales bacterium]|nr:hypothetical protein [Solirubrobacterales bacterium]